MTIQQQVGDFTRRIDFRGGFNWIKSDPSRNYGVSSVKMTFILVGPKGAVQWMIGTEWFPKQARDHLGKFPMNARERYEKPTGYDLGYHAKEPQYEGHSQMKHDCELTGGSCYYDGSSLAADDLVEGFLNGGDEWVWNRLEAYYRCRFEDAAYPDFTPIIEPHPDDKPMVA